MSHATQCSIHTIHTINLPWRLNDLELVSSSWTCYHVLIKPRSARLPNPLRFYSGAHSGLQHRCKDWGRVSIGGGSEGKLDSKKVQWGAGGEPRWQLRDWGFLWLALAEMGSVKASGGWGRWRNLCGSFVIRALSQAAGAGLHRRHWETDIDKN